MTNRKYAPLLLAAVLCSASIAHAAIKDLPDLFVDKFQALANDRTPYGVTDGNPNAATAFFARDAFDNFALTPVLPMIEEHHLGGVVLGARLAGGSINVPRVSSSYFEVSPAIALHFIDTIGMVLSLPIQVRETGSAAAELAGANLGLPISIVHATVDQHFSWQLTPFISTGVGVSSDLAQGGWLYGGGVASCLTYTTGDLRLTLGNQFSWTGGIPIGYSSQYDFKQNVSQPILKNGVKAEYSFGKLVPYGALTYTNLLNDAYVSDYCTPEVGVCWEITDQVRLSVGYLGEFGTRYNSNGGQVTFSWNL